MPAKSRKQQRYLAAKFGEEWLKKHHFDNKTIPKKRASRKKK